MDYKDEIRLDESALDIECLNQPELMVKYSEKLADAKKEKDQLQKQLDIKAAELDLDIRANPEDYDLPKITETSIKNAVEQNEDYQALYDDYLSAKHEADILRGAVDAIEQRKSMIETLVKLHGQQYFAGPSVPRDLVKEREQRQTKVDGKVKIKRRRRE